MNTQYHTFSLVQGRLDLEIIPNRGVSGFALGRDISKILQILEQNLVVLTKINFMVNQNSNNSSHIILEVKPYQLYLIFDQNTQLLERIILADLTKVNLRIKNYIISSHKVSLTSSLVHKVLGPTFPGTYDDKKLKYTISYPGISFVFNIPPKFANLDFNNMELEFPDQTAPQCNTISIQFANPIPTNQIEAPLVQQFQLSEPKLLLATILPDKGINVKLINPNKGLKVQSYTIRFHITSSQDLQADLGPPPQVYYNQEDYMRLHVIPNDQQRGHHGPANSTSIRQNSQFNPTDYFYNYYNLGMDLLLDGITNRVKKLILHTNAPNHFNFNVYQKCHFLLSNELGSIEANSTWSDIPKVLGEPIGRPVLFDRGYGKYQNPFPPSTLRGYSNIIFEVLNNEHIASVTLFQSNPIEPELMDFPSSPPSPEIQHSPTFDNVKQSEQQSKQVKTNEITSAPQVLSSETQHIDDIDEIHSNRDSESLGIEEAISENHFQGDDNNAKDYSNQRVIDMDNLHEAMSDEILNSDSIQEILPDRGTEVETNEVQDNNETSQYGDDAREIISEREPTPEVIPEPEIQENFQFSHSTQNEIQEDISANYFSTGIDSHIKSSLDQSLSNSEVDANQDNFSNLIKEASSDSIFQEHSHSLKSDNTTSSVANNSQLKCIESTSIPIQRSEGDESTSENQNLQNVSDQSIESEYMPAIESNNNSNFLKQVIDEDTSSINHDSENLISQIIKEKREESPPNQQYTLFFKPYEPTIPPPFPTFFYTPKDQEPPFNRKNSIYGNFRNEDSLKPSQSVSDIDKFVDSNEKEPTRAQSLPPISEPVVIDKIELSITDNKTELNETSLNSKESEKSDNNDKVLENTTKSNEPHRPSYILTANIHNDQLINEEVTSTYHTPSSVIKSESNELVSLNNTIETSPYSKAEESVDNNNNNNNNSNVDTKNSDDKAKESDKLNHRINETSSVNDPSLSTYSIENQPSDDYKGSTSEIPSIIFSNQYQIPSPKESELSKDSDLFKPKLATSDSNLEDSPDSSTIGTSSTKSNQRMFLESYGIRSFSSANTKEEAPPEISPNFSAASNSTISSLIQQINQASTLSETTGLSSNEPSKVDKLPLPSSTTDQSKSDSEGTTSDPSNSDESSSGSSTSRKSKSRKSKKKNTPKTKNRGL